LFLGLLTAWALLNIVVGVGESECDGLPAERQSPIDIETSETKCLKLSLIYIPKKTCEDVHLVNEGGHTAQLELDKCDYTILVGLLGAYSVLQAHFHWGEDSTRGSEHTIDGQRYPMEMHIVAKKKFGTSTCAEIAVLGFFFEISGTDNAAWNDIITGLSLIKMPDEKTTINNFNLQDLLPSHKSEFYRYFGSLTTPPYTQFVKWTVFKETIKISESQIAQFRTLLSEHGDNIVDNFREVQPLNGRTVNKNCYMPYEQ
ncbi:unnamed protein product, partial [Owenia fusiformis]